MAGHSKWKQIKHYKAAADAKRGAQFTKLIREITMAAKLGGGDPAGNPRLRTAIETARAASMPKDNIERAVKKGTGELEGVEYQEITYEGYGPGGVAILIFAMTDNPNRTVAEVRHKLSRFGGNLGAANSVSWMFERKGQLYLDATEYPEDDALEAALDAGADCVHACRVSRDLVAIAFGLEVFRAGIERSLESIVFGILGRIEIQLAFSLEHP
jgi:YebC/PmpR family DNA-binding regulatory protein